MCNLTACFFVAKQLLMIMFSTFEDNNILFIKKKTEIRKKKPHENETT